MANPVRVEAPNKHFDGMIGRVQFTDGVAEFDADEHPGVALHCATSGYTVSGYVEAPAGEGEPEGTRSVDPDAYLAAAVPADKNAVADQTWPPVEGDERSVVDVAQPSKDAPRKEWVTFVKLNGFTDEDVADRPKGDLIDAAVRAGIAV